MFIFAYLDDYVWCHLACSDSFYLSFFVEIRRFCRWPCGLIQSYRGGATIVFDVQCTLLVQYKCVCYSVIFLCHLRVLFVCLCLHYRSLAIRLEATCAYAALLQYREKRGRNAVSITLASIHNVCFLLTEKSSGLRNE